MNRDLDISIILCSYNRAAVLQRCLDYLSKQTFPKERWELVLVNDGSTDTTDELIRNGQFPFQYQYIQQSNTGLAGARNSAIRAARGNFLLLINDDTLADPDLLENHWKAQRLYPHSLILGGFDYEPDLLDSAFMQVIHQSDIIFDFANLRPGTQNSYMVSYTCNLLVPAQGYDQAGLFDERYKSYGVEDTEMGYRLFRSGYPVTYYPKAHALHAHKITMDELITRHQKVGTNFVLFFRQHPECAREPGFNGLDRLTRYQIEQKIQSQKPEIEAAIRAIEKLSAENSKSTQLKELEGFLKLVSGHYWSCGLLNGMKIHDLESMLQLPEKRIEDIHPSPAYLPDELPLTVIIPTYNRLPVLKMCLEHLEKQTLPHDQFEVLICDDGSTDNTSVEMANYQASFSLRYLRGANRGPGAARNMGIAQARGKWAVIINDDTLLEPDGLAEHLNIHSHWTGSPIAVLGSFDFPEEFQKTPLQIILNESFFPRATMEVNALHDFSAFWTCNLSLSIVDLRSVGGFDETFNLPASEDTELGFRLAEKFGYRVLYRPDIKGIHYHKHSFESFKRSSIVRGRMTYLLMLKHPRLCRAWLGLTDLDGSNLTIFMNQIAQLGNNLKNTEESVKMMDEEFSKPDVSANKKLVLKTIQIYLNSVNDLHMYFKWFGTYLEILDRRNDLALRFLNDEMYKDHPSFKPNRNHSSIAFILALKEKNEAAIKTIESLKKLSLQTFKIILVDRSENCGLKEFGEIHFPDAVRFEYISRPCSDEVDAIDSALQIVCPNYFVVLKAGEILDPRFLDWIRNGIANTHTGLIFTRNQTDKSKLTPLLELPELRGIMDGDMIPHCTVIQRSTWARIFPLKTKNYGWEWEFYLRCFLAGIQTVRLEEAVVNLPVLDQPSRLVRERMRRIFPDLFSELTESLITPSEVLETLLNDDDLIQSLRENEILLDQPLLEEIQKNKELAIFNEANDLLEGLENLADYIKNVISEDQRQVPQ
jgi:GT2 family glycosyltransferase